MFLYRAYGFIIKSDVRMPELVPARSADRRGRRQLALKLGRHRRDSPSRGELIGEIELPKGGAWRRIWRATDGGFIVKFAELASFAVSSRGDAIICTHRSHGIALRTLRHLVLDQIMPLVLRRHGREALHGTAIATRDGIISFVGPAGTGKSTLAGAFCQAGFKAVADDCLSLIDNGRILGVPAYPGLRLWGDSATALGRDDSPPVAQYTPKQRSFAAENFNNFPLEPLPLARIYRVEREESSQEPRIERIPQRDALLELVQTSFQFDLKDEAALEQHFRFMERVAQSIPICRLFIPEGFEFLPRARDAVLRDLDT